jgi:hypothetical protein
MGTAAVLGVVVASIYLLFPRRRRKHEPVNDQPIKPAEPAASGEEPSVEDNAVS